MGPSRTAVSSRYLEHLPLSGVVISEHLAGTGRSSSAGTCSCEGPELPGRGRPGAIQRQD